MAIGIGTAISLPDAIGIAIASPDATGIASASLDVIGIVIGSRDVSVIATASPDVSVTATVSPRVSVTETGLPALAGTPAGAAVGTAADGDGVAPVLACRSALAVGVGPASTPTHPAMSAWDSAAAAAPVLPVGEEDGGNQLT